MSSSITTSWDAIAVFIGELHKWISCQMAKVKLRGQPGTYNCGFWVVGLMADIMGDYNFWNCIKDLGKQYFNCMVSILEEMSDASTGYFISSKKHYRKNCMLDSGLKAFRDQCWWRQVIFFKDLAVWISPQILVPGGRNVIQDTGGHVEPGPHRPCHWEQHFPPLSHAGKQVG